MLNQNTLDTFMNTFIGYGDFNADTWFIGMEEGGGNSLEDVQTRIGIWAERGGRILEDCAEYHHAIGVGHLFTPPVRAAQRTWDWLMRAQLLSEGKAHDITTSKVMQGERWLRSGSKTCGIELLPLPSPKTSVWHYNQFSNDPILRNRASYKAAMLPTRITAIKNAINTHKPRNVVFYSKQYQAHWQQIAGKDFVEVDGLQVTHSRDTSFFCTMHPAAQIKGAGKKIAYWENIGRRLAGSE
ncbi:MULTISPECIES: hypothetical protein [Pacificibacter]|uniref:hypothetical protein n=1 Tax=Pacificibacter TaxID=1042323 RepID=UPI001C087AC1|nr:MULTISPECIES: hypothetical protein [Pacificibacter]MBU2934496.1 hypothetical protein [Pacificibacter marinus]MDO6617116.1 hypothetical protein [Pacificibacter sp. 1_MG-2023]